VRGECIMKHTHLIALISLLAICLLLVGGVQAVNTITYTSGVNTIVVFNGTAGLTTWTVPTGVTTVSYLVEAAGGGGSNGNANYGDGGGGAGGLLIGSMTVTPTNILNVAIGNGGTGGVVGAQGGNSSFANTTTGNGINAMGGGGGGNGGGFAGGSGGGAGSGGTGGSGVSGQGLAGGSSTGNGGAGGGGNITAGTATANNDGGDGGAGYNFATFDVSLSGFIAGGGGGSTNAAGTTGGAGGSGVGGKGSDPSGDNAADGLPNTGSGGGGSRSSQTARKGGSGVVILKYLTPAPAPVASFTSSNISVATNGTMTGWAGIAPFTMQFTSTSTGVPTSWVWNATNVTGNNAPFTFNTSAYSAPIYPFATAGNYTIKLNATNSRGTNISTQVTWVNVSSGVTLPVPIWSADKYTVVFPGRVNITDTSLNTPTMWNWSAGDGNWHNATIGTNFLYQYTKRGVWQASMTTSNAAGKNTSATKQIRVIGYQGFIPIVPDVCRYSTSRELNLLEKAMTDCKVCNICY